MIPIRNQLPKGCLTETLTLKEVWNEQLPF